MIYKLEDAPKWLKEFHYFDVKKETVDGIYVKERIPGTSGKKTYKEEYGHLRIMGRLTPRIPRDVVYFPITEDKTIRKGGEALSMARRNGSQDHHIYKKDIGYFMFFPDEHLGETWNNCEIPENYLELEDDERKEIRHRLEFGFKSALVNHYGGFNDTDGYKT